MDIDDLKNVSDHPAQVIKRAAPKPEPDAYKDRPLADFVSDSMLYMRGVDLASKLQTYEIENDVVFVALDVDTLLELQKAYKALDYAKTIDATVEFEYLVSDLLGLEDD